MVSARKGKGSGKGKRDPLAWKPFPKVSQLPLLTLEQTTNLNYGLSVMKHPDPIGHGVAVEAFLESAGRECVVPGHVRPVTLLGLQLWPVSINWNFMKPITREIEGVGKFMDVAFDLMQAPFGDR
ncbi:hypothetical protein SUGI_0927890 [Cryptomeria japonica]|uniref:uncharacterized protein LOC131029692 isoform X1 n=1 Tax=Cryptomeria japonica TaxID=3369 RepID=UPI002414A9A3|nr:uncharacterized protein LOC131029692 isoform X1 [Cryptomeria japonica]GLJ44323.1 hypothetical protein SUGI_0927890 [Cryptomeria japonica]